MKVKNNAPDKTFVIGEVVIAPGETGELKSVPMEMVDNGWLTLIEEPKSAKILLNKSGDSSGSEES